MRPGKILALTVAILIVSPSVTAEWREFIPRGFDNGVYVDFFGSYEQDDHRTDAQSYDWRDTFLRARITFFSNGYVYHPRFLLYNVAVGGSVKEEDYRASFVEPLGWRPATGWEYDLRFTFLPEHPYNVELFAQRFEPLFKEQSSIQRNDVYTRLGATFRYRKKPFFFNARYIDSETNSGITQSDVTRYGAGGEYFKRYDNGNQFTVNANYNPSRFSNSTGLKGTSNENLLGSIVDFRRLRFSLSLSQNDTDQQSPSTGTYDSDQSGVYGVVTAYLPLNFRSDLFYRYQDNASVIRGRGESPDQEFADTNESIEFDIVQRLYQSLDSRYVFRRTDRTSSGGDSTSDSHLLGVNYTKLIPKGRVLAGVNVNRTDTDNVGAADVVNEAHPATPVPGSFLLRQENPERNSIVISLRSPVAPFEIVYLDEGVHYTLTPEVNTFRVDVLTLPPPFLVPGDYEFFASYSLTTGAFALRTDAVGYNASVELLDTLLTPYYNYLEIRSKVTEGEFPGTPVNSTSYTAGIRVHYRVLRARGEYQKLNWDVSPFRAWRADVQSVGSITATTSIYANLSYLNKYFPQGRPGQSEEPFTEITTSLSGNVQKRFPSLGMNFSVGGAFTRLTGLYDSRAYSVNSSFNWKVGKLDLAVGASAYGSDTTTDDSLSNGRSHQYYYIKLRRELF